MLRSAVPVDRNAEPRARRAGWWLAALAATLLVAVACSSEDADAGADAGTGAESGPTSSVAEGEAAPGEVSGCVDTGDATEGEAQALIDAAAEVMEEEDLGAVLLSVSVGGEEVVTTAMGESLPGVEATTDMRFYNGAVAFSYLGVAMLRMAEEGTLDLDQPIDRWLPDVPSAEEITPRMLMSSSSGLADFESQQEWVDALYSHPFTAFTDEELRSYVFDEPLLFDPGTNVSYTHLGFRLAGQVIEAAAEQPLDEVLSELVLEPLGLDGTETVATTDLPAPILHTFTDERGVYEETTSWSPAWGVPEGATMLTTVCDLATTASGIGGGELLTDESFQTFVEPVAPDLGQRTDECPGCIPTTEELHFGMGVTVADDWILQTPLFTGIAGTEAYLPSEDIAIGVAVTYGPGGDVGTNGATEVFKAIAAELAPEASLPPQI